MPVGKTQLKAVREALQGREGTASPSKKTAKLLVAVRRESQR